MTEKIAHLNRCIHASLCTLLLVKVTQQKGAWLLCFFVTSSGCAAVCQPKLKPDLRFTAGERDPTTKSSFPRDGRSRFTRATVKLRISRPFQHEVMHQCYRHWWQMKDLVGRRLKILGQTTKLLAITIASNNPLTHFGCNQHAN